MDRMNPRKGGLVLLCAVLAVIGMTGCSTVQSRIKERPTAYQSLSGADRALIARHQIRAGFSKDAVYIAWGRPDRVSKGFENGAHFETWTWLGFYDRPVGFYYDPFDRWYGGFGPLWYPAYETVTYPYRGATFREGRVVAWRAPAG